MDTVTSQLTYLSTNSTSNEKDHRHYSLDFGLGPDEMDGRTLVPSLLVNDSIDDYMDNYDSENLIKKADDDFDFDSPRHITKLDAEIESFQEYCRPSVSLDNEESSLKTSNLSFSLAKPIGDELWGENEVFSDAGTESIPSPSHKPELQADNCCQTSEENYTIDTLNRGDDPVHDKAKDFDDSWTRIFGTSPHLSAIESESSYSRSRSSPPKDKENAEDLSFVDGELFMKQQKEDPEYSLPITWRGSPSMTERLHNIGEDSKGKRMLPEESPGTFFGKHSEKMENLASISGDWKLTEKDESFLKKDRILDTSEKLERTLEFTCERTELTESSLRKLQKKFPPGSSQSKISHTAVQAINIDLDKAASHAIAEAVSSAMAISTPTRLNLKWNNPIDPSDLINSSLDAVNVVDAMTEATNKAKEAVDSALKISSRAANSVETIIAAEAMAVADFNRSHNSNNQKHETESSICNKTDMPMHRHDLAAPRLEKSDDLGHKNSYSNISRTLIGDHFHNYVASSHGIRINPPQGNEMAMSHHQISRARPRSRGRSNNSSSSRPNHLSGHDQRMLQNSDISSLEDCRTSYFASSGSKTKSMPCKRFLCDLGAIVSEGFWFRNSSSTEACICPALIPLSTGCQQLDVSPSVLNIAPKGSGHFVVTYHAKVVGVISAILQFKSLSAKSDAAPYEIILDAVCKKYTSHRTLKNSSSIFSDKKSIKDSESSKIKTFVEEETSDQLQISPITIYPTYISFRKRICEPMASDIGLNRTPSHALPISLTNSSHMGSTFKVSCTHELLDIHPRMGEIGAQETVKIYVWPVCQPTDDAGAWNGTLTISCGTYSRELSTVLDRDTIKMLPSIKEVASFRFQEGLLKCSRKGIYFSKERVHCNDCKVGKKKVILRVKLCNGSTSSSTVFIKPLKAPFSVDHERIILRPRCYVQLPVIVRPQVKGNFSTIVYAYSLNYSASIEISACT